jgi:hypothetical protein
MSTNINVSTLISPDVLSTISSSTVIKTFGDQLKNKAKDKIISTVSGKLDELYKKLDKLKDDKIQLELNHPTELKRLEVLYKNGEIPTAELYNEAVAAENDSYLTKQQDINNQILSLQDNIANIIADPLKKIKAERLKLKSNIQKLKTRNKARKIKINKDRIKKLALNTAKTLAPIIALQLANKFAAVLSQRKRLEELVDQVNAYIDQANTPETIVIATNLRNSTVTLINNNISKLQSLQQTLRQISTYLAIFSALVAVLSAIPIPTAVPPGVGIPVNLILRIVKQIERANKLIIALSALLAIATVLLENEIFKLNELIERLNQVNRLLDSKVLNELNQQQLTDLTSSLLTNVDQYGEYKGFKFKIKEEQTLGAQQAIVVKGNKRHYAVAVNRDGVEVIKSDNSFTLDPNDLVEQLKLIIDQKNLQG